MSASHETSWHNATNPRNLLRLSRVRPSGRQYLLLACVAVRQLVPGTRTEIGIRILDTLERFATTQPRKGIQTHLWNDVVRREIPEIPATMALAWRGGGRDAGWIGQFARRLKSLSQVYTSDVNVIFDIAFAQTENLARQDAVAEVSALTRRLARATGPKAPPRLTIEELREEIVSRYAPERREAARARWAGAADIPTATRAASFLINDRVAQQMAAVNMRACDLVREMFGNPFYPPVIDPSWRTWNYGAVQHIAERIASSGDFADLPILADALEDAGCQDEELLAHCRERYQHVPGCWALDAVLGK